MKKVLVLSALWSVVLGSALPASASNDPVIDLNAIDRSVDPCQDFYHFACGNWIRNKVLPADQPDYNRQSSGLTEETVQRLGNLLSQYAQGSSGVRARYGREMGTLYASCMDVNAIERETPNVLKALLPLVNNVQDARGLAMAIAQLHKLGAKAFFEFGAQPDFANSSVVIAALQQGGMSFKDKSYYLSNDPKSVDIQNHFRDHVARVLFLAGTPIEQAGREAQIVASVERSLAMNALATEDMSDATKLNHPTNFAGLTSLAPRFDWAAYLQTLGLGVPPKINVGMPGFVQGMNALVASAGLPNLKIYLKWQLLHKFGNSLGQDFRNENFRFWSQYLAGARAPAPRWKECTQVVQETMRDALAEAYVNSFPNSQDIRNRTEAMIQQIKVAFDQNLGTLDWLDPQTRAAAHVKLTKVVDRVGFPSKLVTYDNTQLQRDHFATNIQNLATLARAQDNAKMFKATDREIWDMPPWEQNAYYDPPANQMVFPLGALVPPIFDPKFSQGANFGSIGGGWMGHELTHGFDSDGRHFDPNGNLVNWWTPQTAGEFDRRTQCLIDQANHYQILPGVFVNGKQTLTENLADQGGVKMGYQAFLSATANRPPAPNLGPFNEHQQFWIAYAQSWCTKETDEHTRLLIRTDVHPPGEFRTNAVLFNRPEFAADFSCKAGSRMVPAVRCSVW